MIPDVNGRAVGEIMELADEGYVDHASEDEHGGPPSSDQNHADESTTANFIDSLVEDGYFSPPSVTSGSRMPDVMHVDEPVEETPVLNGFMDFTPKLDTPSFGSFGFSTPVVEQPPSLPTGIVLGAVIPPSASKDEVDGAGVPYGRTHHAQRAAEAHQVLHLPEEPIDQPALPKPSVMGGEPMIRSANVTQPALIPLNDRRVSHDRSSDVKAVQDGTFVDPFVTIQTATQVYMSTTETYSDQREEGGIPLGRTSHIERAKVARLMATQSLGLGLPNHPVQPSLPSTMRPGRRHISYGESEDGSEAEDSEGDDLDAIVQPPPIRQPANLSTPPKEERMSERRPPLSEKLEKLCSPVMGNAAKRTLPKPPQPRPLDIPNPKHAPTPEPENPVRSTSPTVSHWIKSSLSLSD
jgi:serine/arginine repetitive matrix protein 2